MRKQLMMKGSSKTVTMSASHNLSEYADANFAGDDTVSFKFNMRIIGMREDDSNVAFVKAALNTFFSGLSGSFSFKLPLKMAAEPENEKRLIKIMDAWHKEADYMLSLVYNQLSEEDKAMGKKIAYQNAVRTFLLGKFVARTDCREYVEDLMERSGLLIIPRGIQLESTITSGTRVLYGERMPGFKSKYDEILGDNVWVKNGEIYGRKRVPLKGEKPVLDSFEAIAEMAQSWEDFWKGATYDSAEDILNLIEQWTNTLKHQDHEIVVNKLSEEEMKKAQQEALKIAMEVR